MQDLLQLTGVFKLRDIDSEDINWKNYDEYDTLKETDTFCFLCKYKSENSVAFFNAKDFKLTLRKKWAMKLMYDYVGGNPIDIDLETILLGILQKENKTKFNIVRLK